MPTPRSAHAVALAVAVLAACGERAPSAPPTPSAPVAGTATTVAPEPAVPPTAADAAPAAVPPVGAAAAPSTAAQVAPAPGTAPAAAPSNSSPSPAGPASVATVLEEAVAVEPGGATVALAAGAEAVIDPGARFRVVLAAVSEDARLLLLDSSDAVVAGEGAHELGQATRLTFAPSAPLVPGRRYTLRVDGAATRELHGASGTAFTPASLKVLVAGAPPAPEPKEQPATRRKRRSR